MTTATTDLVRDAQRAAGMLDGLPNVREALPVLVTIGRTTFAGAAYSEHKIDGYPLASATTRYYLLGLPPASYRNRKVDGFHSAWKDGRAYYVAGHWSPPMGALTPAEIEIFHPLGAWWILAPFGAGHDVARRTMAVDFFTVPRA